ncbi:hypothetical protein BH11PAT4_BH11PAT4_4180 [soil metagenome]
MQLLSKHLRSLVGTLTLCATLFFVVSPAQATAPPPAGSLCAFVTGLCDAAPVIPPDMRFTARAAGVTVTASTNTRVEFPVQLQVTSQTNDYALSYVRFYDAKNVLTAPDACTTFRINTLSPSIGVLGEPGVPTPWARAVDNEVWGSSFGPKKITFTEVPRNKLSMVEIGVSCTYLGKTYKRSVRFKVLGLDDISNGAPSMTFKSVNAPVVDADDPSLSGTAKLYWTLKNDVGTCQITDVRKDGQYIPDISAWGGDGYIKANPEAALGVVLTVDYPDRPGAYRYIFSMRCSKVAGPIEKAILAVRSFAGGGGGSGAGKVLNYGGGTQRF